MSIPYHIHDFILIIIDAMLWSRKVPKSVCVCVCVWGGGGGGAHIHVIYVPSVKNQYKRVVFGYMVI